MLQEFLGSAGEGLVLEVASGTGQHTAHFSCGLPRLTFQPTEYAAESVPRCGCSLGKVRGW